MGPGGCIGGTNSVPCAVIINPPWLILGMPLRGAPDVGATRPTDSGPIFILSFRIEFSLEDDPIDDIDVFNVLLAPAVFEFSSFFSSSLFRCSSFITFSLRLSSSPKKGLFSK